MTGTAGMTSVTGMTRIGQRQDFSDVVSARRHARRIAGGSGSALRCRENLPGAKA
ncbi:hypothetical protein [Streptomyces sp. NPDC052015]|uniref:hypothetical protein n=1 Tax=Streptomyces sp. NPDC052015 TaxID=3154755 RepID=UPI00343DE84F